MNSVPVRQCAWSVNGPYKGRVRPLRTLILLLLIILMNSVSIESIDIMEDHFQPYKHAVPLLLSSFHFFLELVQHVRLDPNWPVQTCAMHELFGFYMVSNGSGGGGVYCCGVYQVCLFSFFFKI